MSNKKSDTKLKKFEFFENLKAEKTAEKFYSGDLPYHNFSHVKETMANGKIIVKNCHKKGVPIDEKVVYYGNLFHNAGYHENHKEEGFSSKEEYSAYLAGKILKNFGENKETISKTQSVILATHRDRPFLTNEEKAVRASDLADMAKDYQIFFGNTANLKREMEIISGHPISRLKWKNHVKKIIGFYLNQDIRLTKVHDDENRESVWHKKVKENLEMFLKDDEKICKNEQFKK